MPGRGIKVSGLDRLSAALRTAEDRLPEMTETGHRRATAIVASTAVPTIPSVTGAARRSVRTSATPERGTVTGGNSDVPYYGWLEFGGSIRHHGSSHSHQRTHLIVRPRASRGRYLIPAYERRRAEIQHAYEQVVSEHLRRARLA